MIKFTLSGLAIGVVLIALIATTFATVSTDIREEYNLTDKDNIGDYGNKNSSIYDEIRNTTEEIRDATDISQEDSWLDVIGGYFSAGYSALKTSAKSFKWVNMLMDEASEDVPEFKIFQSFLIYIILIGLFIGVVIAVLVKMRI